MIPFRWHRIFRILLAVCSLSILSGPHRLAAADEKPVRTKLEPVPWHDPDDMPFRRAPMANATRSVLIPVATNLFLAFDTEKLNFHVAWQGGPPNLWGAPYHGGKDRFYADFKGDVLWTQPGIFPWRVKRSNGEHYVDSVPESRFIGISTKNESTTLIYKLGLPETGQSVAIHESARHRQRAWETTIERRYEIAPCQRSLTLIAHAENGHFLPSPAGKSIVLIDRGTNVLLVAARATCDLIMDSVMSEVDYDQTVWSERKTDSEVTHLPAKGKQARVLISIPVHTNDVSVEVLSLVASNAQAALQLMGTLPRRPIQPPNMAFLLNQTVPRVPVPPKIAPVEKTVPLAAGDESYRIESFPLPKEIALQVTGMDFLPNGNLIVCTWLGDVYIVEKPTGPTSEARYTRFAGGLCEPGGLKVINGQIYVTQKQELTRLVDTDGNGEADFYWCISQDWGFTGNYHDFTFGPALDKHGDFYLLRNGNHGVYEVPRMGWCLKIDRATGMTEPFCDGLRSPNGFATYGPDKDIFMCDNQGNWIGACTLTHLQQGRFYGFPSTFPAAKEDFNGQRDGKFTPPAVWFPYKVAKSASGIAPIQTDKFGPFKGQLLVGDFQNAIVMRVFLEKVNGEWQGATWPFAKGFGSGVNRLAFGPDQQLYVGGLKNAAWAAVAPKDYSLDRVVYTGKAPFEVKEVHARSDGFDLTFTEPVDPQTATNVDNYDLLQYRYHYQSKYGSAEYDHTDKENSATPIKVVSAQVWDNGLTVRLQVQGWKTGFVTMVRCLDVANTAGKKLRHDTFWYTLNQLPAASSVK